jgi:hypothetical protein
VRLWRGNLDDRFDQVIGVPDPRYGEEACAWIKLRPAHGRPRPTVQNRPSNTTPGRNPLKRRMLEFSTNEFSFSTPRGDKSLEVLAGDKSVT